MNDRPGAAELLDIARRTLLEDILPRLPKELRYGTLMIANAMAIAGREHATAGADAEAEIESLARLFAEPSAQVPGTALQAALADYNRRLAGVLDWEFAAFGNPLEDVGWIFAKCWRFAAKHLPCGGIAAADDFLLPYQRASGRTVTPEALVYWQVMAHVRWAVIALQQAQRHLSGVEPSLELALTGRIVAELEHEIVALTG